MIVGAAEESEAVGENFESSLAEHQTIHLGPFFEDLENQVLFFESGVFGDLFEAGLLQQLLHGQCAAVRRYEFRPV